MNRGGHQPLCGRPIGGCIGSRKLCGRPAVVTPHGPDCGRGLRGHDRIGVGEQINQAREGREGIFPNPAERPGGMPTHAKVVVERVFQEVVESPAGVLAKRGDLIDCLHPGILVV